MSAAFVTSYPAPEFVHVSDLTAMAMSPKHFKNQLTKKRGDSPAMLFGRVVHAMLFDFGKWVVFEHDRTGNRWKEFKAEHPKEDIITTEEYEVACDVVRELRQHEHAAPLLVGKYEVEIQWMNLGVKCAGRLDIVNGAKSLTDLKVTSTIEPRRFNRIGLGLHYAQKLAWYFDALEIIGSPVETAHMITVEDEPPHDIVIYNMEPNALDFGRRSYRLWLERLIACRKSDEWPGFAQYPIPFEVPEALVFPDEE